MNGKVLFALAAVAAMVITGSAVVAFTTENNVSSLNDDNLVVVRDTDLEEKIFDKFVHDHSLESRKAIAFSKIIEGEKLDFEDRLILNSLDKHDLSIAKRVFFAKVLDENELLLKKQLLFNALHEFDRHNFHDFDHDLHLGSGFNFQDVLEESDFLFDDFDDDDDDDDFDSEDCAGVFTRHNGLQKICP